MIRAALTATPDKSASDIAKEIGVSSALVYNVKANLAKKNGKAAGKKKAGRHGGGKANTAEGSGNKAEGSVNKAERIRQVAKSLGKTVRPRDVIAVLAGEGIKVSSPQVSKTLSAAGYRQRGRGKGKGRKTAAATAKTSASSNGLNLEALIAAKTLIQKVGSVELAQEALAAMKKLG